MSRLFTAKGTRVAVATALIATVFAIASGTPTSAAPQTKTLTGSCVGADEASKGILGVLGGALTIPFDVTSDVPAQLDPEAPDQPIAFTWSVTISPDMTSKVAAIDPLLRIKDMVLDIGVSGPTATKEVQGRPAPVDIAVTAGQPATVAMGPFSGSLTEIGKGGIIKYSAKSIALTISIDMPTGATDVKVNCSAPGTVAITSIKIPGSPDIVQPISIEGTANSSVSVDVLGKYVTPGTDDDGKQHPVDPTSLKVVEGPGQVVDGQVVVNTGEAGTTASVTFEVCAGTLPGTNEVQTLMIDEQQDLLRRGVGLTIKNGEEETAPIWLVNEAYQQANPDQFTKPTNWSEQYFNYLFAPFAMPTPAAIQAALEALPSIGEGGVKVTEGEDGDPADHMKPYLIEFTGSNGEKDVPSLSIGSYYSILPQEYLAAIIDAATGLMNGEEGEPEVLPGGATTPQEAIEYLNGQAALAFFSFNFPLWLDLTMQTLPFYADAVLAGLDVNAIIAWITAIFSTPPATATLVAGEPPIGICSQGVIDVDVPAPTTATVAGTTAVNTGAEVAGAGMSFAG